MKRAGGTAMVWGWLHRGRPPCLVAVMLLGPAVLGIGCSGATSTQPRPCPPCANSATAVPVGSTTRAEPTTPTGPPTLAEAQQFVADAERELKRVAKMGGGGETAAFREAQGTLQRLVRERAATMQQIAPILQAEEEAQR